MNLWFSQDSFHGSHWCHDLENVQIMDEEIPRKKREFVTSMQTVEEKILFICLTVFICKDIGFGAK